MRRMMFMWIALASLGACAEGVAPDSSGYREEVRGGNLHHEAIGGAIALDTVLALPAMAPAIGPLRAADFTSRTVEQRGPTGLPLVHVQATQTVGGVPIAGAYLYLTMTPAADDGDGAARLLGSSYRLFHGVEVDTTPELDGGEAEVRAREALRQPPDAPVRQRRLAIHELDGVLTLVWEVSVADDPRRALVRASGELAGRVEPLDDRMYESRGTIHAWIAEGGAPGGGGTAMRLPLAEARVWAGDETTLSARDGGYVLDAPAGSTIAAALLGPAAEVTNRAGSAAIASGPASARVDLTIGGTGEQALAQATAFHAITAARRFVMDNGLDGDALGAPLATRVNVPGTCNAYYAPSARTVNFLRSGGGCNNSAETSIVLHEYGHFVDDSFGGITDGGLSEGWGDVLACFVLRRPEIGPDLERGAGPLRTCDNDYRYPAGGRDEVHDLGQAWAGFAWHLRAELIATMGETRGDALARALILPSLASGAPDIPAAVREVFLRDDDDRDVANGSPHQRQLLAAARRHGLERFAGLDESPPGRVEDLQVIAATATSVTVRWTAPGDDGRRGTAARYDLRWSAEPITAATFARATAADAPAPLGGGQRQETTIEVPPLARIHVALRAVDDLGNLSKLSNVAAADLPAPVVAYHEDAERGLGAWQATGMWHVTRRDAGAGRQSFWFGREDSGTFESGGSPAAGTLTSPEVDLAGVAAPRLAFLERVDVERDLMVDRLDVEVFDVADPTVKVTAGKVTGHTRGFVPRLIDLSRMAGRRVRIRFVFDSVDGRLDGMTGWFVDEIRVLAAGPSPTVDAVLVINEVLADPPSGFDASGDGVASARGDELIELVNGGGLPIDLGGAMISDGLAVRATLAAGTVLAPGRALVVFGGPARALPGVITVSTEGLSLNNDGDAVIVRRPDGRILAELRYGTEGGADQSLTRRSDGDRLAPMVGHRSVSALPASPGLRHDGRPFGELP